MKGMHRGNAYHLNFYIRVPIMHIQSRGFAAIAFFLQLIHKYLIIIGASLMLAGASHARPVVCDDNDEGVNGFPVLVGTIPSGYTGYLGYLEQGGVTITVPRHNFSMYMVPSTATAASWRIVRARGTPEGNLGPDAPGNTLVSGGTVGNPLVLNNLSNFEEQNGAVAYIDSINGTATLYQICSNTPFPVSDTTPSRIPTMTEWGLGLMALGLLAVAGWVRRRRAPGT